MILGWLSVWCVVVPLVGLAGAVRRHQYQRQAVRFGEVAEWPKATVC